MGIHGLSKLIADHAPSAVKENEIKNFFGLFVFMISVSDNEGLIICRQKSGS